MKRKTKIPEKLFVFIIGVAILTYLFWDEASIWQSILTAAGIMFITVLSITIQELQKPKRFYDKYHEKISLFNSQFPEWAQYVEKKISENQSK